MYVSVGVVQQQSAVDCLFGNGNRTNRPKPLLASCLVVALKSESDQFSGRFMLRAISSRLSAEMSQSHVSVVEE